MIRQRKRERGRPVSSVCTFLVAFLQIFFEWNVSRQRSDVSMATPVRVLRGPTHNVNRWHLRNVEMDNVVCTNISSGMTSPRSFPST